MKRTFRLSLVRVFVHAVLAAASCAWAGDIVVAQVAPFTGGIAMYSNATNLGASVLFQAVNAEGGINGSQIKIIKHDDKLDAKLTLELFEEVARTERPVAFFYPVGPVAIAALIQQGVPQKLGIPVLGTIPAMHKLRTPVNPYVFHVGVGDDAELVKIVEHMATIGFKRIGIAYWDEPSAHEAVAFIEAQAKRRQLAVTLKVPVEAGTDKVDAAVRSTLRASPAVVITILPVHATAAFVKGLRAAKNLTPVYGPSYTESSALANIAGPDYARGSGISQVVPNPFSGSTPLVREYQQRMRQYAPAGTRFSTLSLEGYIAAKILVEALRHVGPNPTGVSLKASLEKQKNLNLGGLVVNYSPQQHVGLTFLDISVVGYDGSLMY